MAAVALTAMVIPLALAARDVVQIKELGEAAALARAEAAHWEGEHREEGPGAVPESSADNVTFIAPSGATVGPQPAPDSAQIIAAAHSGVTSTTTADGWGYAASPAYLAGGQTGVVLVTLSPAAMREDLWPRLAAIAAVSGVLLGLAALASWRLAKQTVAPLAELTLTAHRVADGDLEARAQSSTLPEIDQVALALNRVTERVQELLADERTATAELAHQLRTPLTVIRVDIDGVPDPAVRDRLRDDLEEVQRMVDEIIDTARRPVREGLVARCDAAAVVAGRIRFWQVLAEDQVRTFRADVEDGPFWVRLTPEDLATAVDILLQNVFVHTPEGTPFSVLVAPARDGMVDVTVTDEGPGFHRNEPTGSGSTGLGLSIAARLAQASGGRLQVDTSKGTAVTLVLGPAGT